MGSAEIMTNPLASEEECAFNAQLVSLARGAMKPLVIRSPNQFVFKKQLLNQYRTYTVITRVISGISIDGKLHIFPHQQLIKKRRVSVAANKIRRLTMKTSRVPVTCRSDVL